MWENLELKNDQQGKDMPKEKNREKGKTSTSNKQ